MRAYGRRRSTRLVTIRLMAEPWPDVAVLVPTYNRAPVVARTVELVLRNMQYSGRVSVHVGVDGTDDTVQAMLPYEMTGRVHVVNSPKRGLGANVNHLVRECKADYMIAMDDDHHLIAPLCLDRHVEKLQKDHRAAWIHLLMEARGDEHFDNYKFKAELDKDHYWRVDWQSAEHFIMSFRPHLFTRRWVQVMGMLPEGLKTGRTEYTYAAHVKQMGQSGVNVDVLVPLTAPGRETWAHDAAPESWNRKGL